MTSKDFRVIVEEEEELEKEMKGEGETILSPSSGSVYSDDIFGGEMKQGESASYEENIEGERILKIQIYVLRERGRHERKFRLPTRYVPLRLVAEASNGFIIAAYDKKREIKVAIKPISLYSDQREPEIRSHDFLKRILREIFLLRHFAGHSNVIELVDLVPTSTNFDTFHECLVITDLMDFDLYHMIREESPISEPEIQRVIYDTLKGLKYIHEADVVHRDLKPQNILLKRDNNGVSAKICDFGMSRDIDFDVKMANYVVTRWYRAPEALMMWGKTSKSIDIWSVGCMMGELLSGSKKLDRVMFKGSHWIDQLERIVKFRGSPEGEGKEEDDLLGSASAMRFVKGLGTHTKKDLAKKYPDASAEALDLLDKLLVFDARKRITAEEAIKHPYFAKLYEGDDQKDDSILKKKTCSSFLVRVSDEMTPEQLRKKLYDVTVEWSKLQNDNYEQVIVLDKVIKLEEKE